MDIEHIKEKIYHLSNDDKKIQPGEYLSAEIISILRDGNISDRVACFAPTKDIAAQTKKVCLFPSEITCSECQKSMLQNLSKQSLLDYLRGAKTILCSSCEEALKIKNEEEREKQLKFYKERKINYTKEYILKYLDPNQVWDEAIKLYERQKLILDQSCVDHDMIARHIQGMTYKDF